MKLLNEFEYNYIDSIDCVSSNMFLSESHIFLTVFQPAEIAKYLDNTKSHKSCCLVKTMKKLFLLNNSLFS